MNPIKYLTRAWIRDWYSLPEHESGGPLHIVVDDHNVEEEHILFCVREAFDEPPEIYSKLIIISGLLLMLTEEERLECVQA